jgi:hypothetical protein
LTKSGLKEDGIHVTPHKTLNTTGKRLIIGWPEVLYEAVLLAKDARLVKLPRFLFCNRQGECYFDEKSGRAEGWNSMWREFCSRVLQETKVEQNLPNMIYGRSVQAMHQALNMRGHYWPPIVA